MIWAPLTSCVRLGLTNRFRCGFPDCCAAALGRVRRMAGPTVCAASCGSRHVLALSTSMRRSFLRGQLGVEPPRRHRPGLASRFALSPAQSASRSRFLGALSILAAGLGGCQHASDSAFNADCVSSCVDKADRFMFRRVRFDLRAASKAYVAEFAAALRTGLAEPAETAQPSAFKAACGSRDRSEVRRIERDNRHEIVRARGMALAMPTARNRCPLACRAAATRTIMRGSNGGGRAHSRSCPRSP